MAIFKKYLDKYIDRNCLEGHWQNARRLDYFNYKIRSARIVLYDANVKYLMKYIFLQTLDIYTRCSLVVL